MDAGIIGGGLNCLVEEELPGTWNAWDEEKKADQM